MSATLHEQVKSVIDTLPQRGVIPDAVAERWISGIIEMDPERAVWHARRAAGIGGSEVGELLRRDLGMQQLFKSPEQISREKLLLDLPEPDNPYIRRGRELERLAQRVYERLTGRSSVKDKAQYRAIFDQPHKHYPFAVGNPDDINETDQGIVIPDYKVRSSLDWSADIDLNYSGQCHWYGSIYTSRAEVSGEAVSIDHYALAELDIPNNLLDGLLERLQDPKVSEDECDQMIERMAAQVAEWNIRGFGMKVTAFDHDPQLANDLFAAAQKLWDGYVLEGVPYYETRQLQEPDAEVRERVQQLTRELGDARVAQKAAEDTNARCTSELSELGAVYDLSGCVVAEDEYAPLSITQTPKLDIEAAAKHLISQGHELETLSDASKGKVNSQKAVELLQANGIDPAPAVEAPFDPGAVKMALKADDSADFEDFQSPGCRVALSTKKADKPRVEGHVAQMRQHLAEYQLHVRQDNDPSDDPESGASIAMA